VSGRAARRGLVLSLYLGYALILTLFATREALPSGWFAPLAFILLLVTALSYIGLYTSTRSVADASDGQLDERERSVRDSAYRFAYQALSGTFLLSAFYTMVAMDGGSLWFPRTLNEASAVFWGVFLLATTLPTAIIAWREPDPVDDDPHDG
jgi:hypothetical protein